MGSRIEYVKKQNRLEALDKEFEVVTSVDVTPDVDECPGSQVWIWDSRSDEEIRKEVRRIHAESRIAEE